MRRVCFDVHPHNAKRKAARLLWYPEWMGRGTNGRRYERKNIAWMLGWSHEQNEEESGDPVSECPWTKPTYRREYGLGRLSWRRAFRGAA